jgi:AcrR family transcriptional regulator
MPSNTAGRGRTRQRIVEAALDAFGTRGYDATSLDALAADLGIAKQSVLYWFPSKEALLDAVVADAAASLVRAIDAGLARHVDDDPVEVVMRVVFRVAVRQPALLGMVREVGRLGPEVAEHLAVAVRPLLERAVSFCEERMDAGAMRRADPRLLVLFVQATIVGVATDREAQRAVGWEPTAAGLAHLRRELFAFVRSAVGRGPALSADPVRA